jgi:hypothetical protein
MTLARDLANTANDKSIVQIVYASTGSEKTVSNNTYVDTNLTGTITPTSASNKVLVMVTHGSNQKDANNTGMAMRLMRDATEIVAIIGDGGKTGTNARNNFGGTSINYLDTPNTTSAVTYKTQFMSQGNNASVAVQSEGRISSIVLMEVTP